MDVAVPQWMINAEDTDKRPVRTIEQPVLLNSVRLVFPLTDPDTGVTRDVIVKKLVNGKMWFDRHTGKQKWSRIIPGLNIKVPWPKVDAKEHKDFPVDTLRLDVESKTFVPTLLRPPMPNSVIDELRNKYSIFRTRHDHEYIAAKIAEDQEKEAKKKLAEEMRTPLKEINRKERKLRKAKGKGKLTKEMLEKIGQVIAKKRQLALDAAGMSKVGKEPEPLAA
jgi:large subunit ribosomal protein L24